MYRVHIAVQFSAKTWRLVNPYCDLNKIPPILPLFKAWKDMSFRILEKFEIISIILDKIIPDDYISIILTLPCGWEN